MSLEKLTDNVAKWGKEKGIIEKENIHAQTIKVFEEAGELAKGILKKDEILIKDSIGDTMVTLILLAEQNDMTLEECLQYAWDEIKGRTGKMVDGSFIKDE